MLPSVLPKLTTDSAVRVFPGVWKLFSLRLPSRDGAPSLHLLSLFSTFIFFPTCFWRQWSLFWVPDVLCQHSDVVLWSLLSVEMFFWWIWEGKSGLPVLFLYQLRTTPEYWVLSQPFHSPISPLSRDSLVALCFFHKGSVICTSQVIDISPGNLDYSLCFIQPGILYDVLCIEAK